MSIQGVIFDLGSTLIHATYDQNWVSIYPRMQADLLAHLRAHGYTLDEATFFNRLTVNRADFDRQRQTDWVEYTTAWLLTTTLKDLGQPEPSPAVMDGAIQAYYAWTETQWATLPGTHETLRALQARGLRLAILSNASDHANVHRLIDRAHLRPYFDPIVVSAAVRWRKPNPRAFEEVLHTWQVPAQACVMVGDTLGADILGAQLAGLHDVWLTAHADHAANRAHRGNIIPTHSIAALTDLLPLLETLDRDP